MKTIILFTSFFAFALTTFGQITWTQIPSGTDKNLNTIQFVDDLVGYIGGDSIILKTTDGGVNWTELQLDSLEISAFSSFNVQDMHWFSEQHGIILASNWGFWETYDGGNSW